MANKPLKTVRFPGLGNTYTVPQVDKTLTVEGGAADAKKVGEELTNLKADLSDVRTDVNSIIFDNKTKTLAYEIASGKTVVEEIAIKKGTRFSLTCDVNDNGERLTLYYTDGTDVSNIAFRTGINYRAEKDIRKFSLYNGHGSTINVSVTLTIEDLPVTNYYDKSKKISGYISGGSIVSGYYHSDFIPVALGDTIIANAYPSTFGSARIYFYDSSKNYKGHRTGTLRDDGFYEFTLPLSTIGSAWVIGDIYYAAFNMSVAGSEVTAFYINNVPDTKMEYGQYSPDTHDFFNKQQKEYISMIGSMPIAGKKIAYNGDSICESRLQNTSAYNGGGYAKIIGDIVGGTYENRAISGGVLASAVPSGTNPARFVVSDITNMASDADLVCIEGGINDYWRNVPLGDYTQNDYTGTLDTTTICGALESIFRQAMAKWVGKPIVFVITHKITSTVYAQNAAGYTWAQVHDKMVEICNKYAIPYYDAYAESGLNAYVSAQNTEFLTANSTGNPDGCHPNEAGYKKYYVPQLIALFNSVMPRS